MTVAPHSYRLGSGETVVYYFDPLDSAQGRRIDADLLSEALSTVHSEGQRRIKSTVDLGRRVGENRCVRTSEGDLIEYLKIGTRFGYGRFVKGRKPVPSTRVTVMLAWRQSFYVVLDAYVGPLAPPWPWDPRADPNSAEYWRSVEFWACHALVLEDGHS